MPILEWNRPAQDLAWDDELDVVVSAGEGVSLLEALTLGFGTIEIARAEGTGTPSSMKQSCPRRRNQTEGLDQEDHEGGGEEAKVNVSPLGTFRDHVSIALHYKTIAYGHFF